MLDPSKATFSASSAKLVRKQGLTDAIDALLPQTQCTRCGFEDCRAYARALEANETDINRCPPGGESTLRSLSELLDRPVRPLDPLCGTMPAQAEVAFIEEDRCIGCFKCIQACPVDAIVGAPKLMHTIISVDCSGCELCLPVCPTDCIVMLPRAPSLPSPADLAGRWRNLHIAHDVRRAREHSARENARRTRRGESIQDRASAFDIAGAIARARSRRGQSGP